MNKTTRQRRFLVCGVGLLLLAACGTAIAADVQGAILKKDGGRLSGSVRYLPASKEYMVTSKGVTLRVGVDQVAKVKVTRPPELDQAIRAIRAGQHMAAVPVLEKIMRDYRMLEHDVTAAGYLASSYLKMKKPADAVRMCQKVIEGNPKAGVVGDLAVVYWQALLQSGREATLGKLLSEAIQIGDRTVAARAQVMRGDIEMKNGRFREALIDGFLRTAILYQDVKGVQPEALYKASKCFDQLEQHAHAEKMRKRLLARFPNDPYTKKLQSGT